MFNIASAHTTQKRMKTTTIELVRTPSGTGAANTAGVELGSE